MCMITLVPANVPLPIDGIENGALTNDDGHGWAIASERHGLEVFKSMSSKKAIEALVEAREKHGMNSIVLFHSRWATHGTVNEFNIHPFYVDEAGETVMAHNGVLPSYWYPAKEDPRSDTRCFVDWTAPHYMTATGVPSRRGSKELGKRIGLGNKLVFLSVASGKPKVRIVNADMGTHSGGVWYSNDGFKPSKYTWRNWDSGKHTSYWDADEWAWENGRYVSKQTCGTPMVLGSRKEEEGEEESLFSDNGFADYACETCDMRQTIYLNTGICQACGSCEVCFEEERDCDCWFTRTRRHDEEQANWVAEVAAAKTQAERDMEGDEWVASPGGVLVPFKGSSDAREVEVTVEEIPVGDASAVEDIKSFSTSWLFGE